VSERIGFRGERGSILAALMLAMALVALDSTIIATAVPSVVRDLGGFNEFPWLFSAYLCAQAVTVPVFGKLADIFGRKPLILFGIGMFLLGSVLCGVAWTLPVLIAFRAVQGIGAGAIQSMSTTIVGDLFSLVERAKAQGYMASVWGAASVVGPAAGGVFAEYLTWRWIFFINVPLCLAAGTLLVRRLRENVAPARSRVDVAGAALLVPALTLLLLAILEGGQVWPWTSATELAALGAAAVLLAGFVWHEAHHADPIMPSWVFRRRQLVTTSLASAGVGGVSYGLSSFVPAFAQDILGAGPVLAGAALAAMTLAWPIASARAGGIYLRFGFRVCALGGTLVALAGTVALTLIGAGSTLWDIAVACLIVGFGMGFVAAPVLIAAQSLVSWQQRGVVTGANMFARSIGSALSVAVYGAIANSALTAGAAGHGTAARAPLEAALHHVFIAVAACAALTACAVLGIPGGRPQTAPPPDASGGCGTAGIPGPGADARQTSSGADDGNDSATCL
jgi:EmrB/QacA subfamily drug resistance transporter